MNPNSLFKGRRKFLGIISTGVGAILAARQTGWGGLSFARAQRSGFSLNPGFFVIINPENNSANRSIWIGTIRGIFLF